MQYHETTLTFSTLRADSAYEKLKFSTFPRENIIWHLMKSVPLGDNMHEVSNSVLGGK